MPKYDTTKEFLDATDYKFNKSDKTEIADLMSNSTDAKYDNLLKCKGVFSEITQMATRFKR